VLTCVDVLYFDNSKLQVCTYFVLNNYSI